MDNRSNVVLVVLALVVVGLVGLLYWGGLFTAPSVEVESPASRLPPPDDASLSQAEGSPPPADGSPRFPMPEPPPGTAEAIELVSLPALDDSDAYFLLELASKFGPTVEAAFVREAIIDKLVVTIDGLTREQLPLKLRPVGQLKESFTGDMGRDGELILGPSSWYRYDALIATAYYADLDAVYDMYQRFYPLFQKSYEQLGYPDGYFNDRLIEVIDHLLAMPDMKQTVVLTRPNVLYEYADPEFEALSSGRKLLLRMGVDNAATTKRLLEKFRAKLVGS